MNLVDAICGLHPIRLYRMALIASKMPAMGQTDAPMSSLLLLLLLLPESLCSVHTARNLYGLLVPAI